METFRKKVLLIINPCAGKSKKRPDTFDIVKCFPADYKIDLEFTRCQGDATRIVKEKTEGHDIVVCCGGDGTLNEVINGIMDMPTRVPVGYIPIGTTNDLATTLGIPSKVEDAVNLIVGGHMNWYDIGLFNNRYFTYTAAFGAFTKSSYNTSQKMKNRFGHAAYIMNGLTEWKNIESIHAVFECDQGKFEGNFCFGTITDSTSVAGVFKLDENEVRLDDGKFELVMVSELKNLAQAPALLRQMQRKDYDGKRIFMFHTSKVKITFDREIPWTVDGEFGGNHKEVITHNLSKAIRIFSPPGKLFNADTPTDIEAMPVINLQEEAIKEEVREKVKEKVKEKTRERAKDKEKAKAKSEPEETPEEVVETAEETTAEE